jgi:uncharacterized protein (TIGR03437 family)
LRQIGLVDDVILLAGDADPVAIPDNYPFPGSGFGSNPLAFVAEMGLDGSTFRFGPLMPGFSPSFAVANRNLLYVGTGARLGASSLGGRGENAFLAALDRRPPPRRLRVQSAAGAFDGSIDLLPGDLAAISTVGLDGVEAADLGINSGRNLPLELNGVRVLFGGHPAPIVAVSPDRIVCVVPSALRTLQDEFTFLEVEHNGDRSAPRLSLVRPWPAPKALIDDSLRLVARNEDGSVNGESNPARRGSIVTIYATGLGPVQPWLPDGSIAPVSPSRPMAHVEVARSGGPRFEVVDVATMPGFLSAVFQINVRLPDQLPFEEPNLPLLVSVDGGFKSAYGYISVK